jgi:glutamate dehydrogenase
MINPDEFDLETAYQTEIESFKKFFLWIKESMPKKFFREVDRNTLTLIAQNLISFEIQGLFSVIQIKNIAIVLCIDSPKADLKILKNFSEHGIRYYRTYTSNAPPPINSMNENLKIGFLHYTEGAEESGELPQEKIEKISSLIKEVNPNIDPVDVKAILQGMHHRFLLSMSEDRLLMAINMFFRAKRDDACQIDVKKIDNFKEIESPSLKLVLACKNTPKKNFLFRVAKAVKRHNLVLTRFTSTYINPFSSSNILIMSMGIDGLNGNAAWETGDLESFYLELSMLKFFDEEDLFEKTFVDNGQISGHESHFFRAACNFIHQGLTTIDPNQYSFEQIEKDLCRHPNLALLMLEAFQLKFHPTSNDYNQYEKVVKTFQKSIVSLDTGQPFHDERKKNVLTVGMDFVIYCLKTNFFKLHKSALGFRMDPNYLSNPPVRNNEVFPEVPYGIFFIVGMHFIGFHIRFKDLSRGGLRTVISKGLDQLTIERNQTFTECYNLAYTQQKKNKDIPEGGAKGVILLEPFEIVKGDSDLLEQEMKLAKTDKSTINSKIQTYKEKMQLEFLYASQRSYVATLLSLINCDENEKLRAIEIIDYLEKPEYIYLGPDENMHNNMITWIADYSSFVGYKPGRSFISSKPGTGINHKEYGVTSFGVNTYMHQTLLFLGIDPEKDTFTVKISGGPDGDVAGNQINNLHRFYKNTAKVVAITDVSGTIYDPEGLDLDVLLTLFNKAKSIRHYPAKLLHDEGFLLDLQTVIEEKSYQKNTLCYRKKKGKLIEDYISGNDMHHIFKTNVHHAIADVFIPAGGRPRTLNKDNYTDFLDVNGTPSAKAIVEGANLYLTPFARNKYQELGVLIIKDSSCNKGGVITSSMEVLSALVLTEEQFLENKEVLVSEILNFIEHICYKEAKLIFETFQETGEFLTEISDKISKKINRYKYEILAYLQSASLSDELDDPFIRALLLHCPPFIRHNYPNEVLTKIPDIHKKAIIAVFLASNLVYTKGVFWTPSVIDTLKETAERIT